MSIAERLAAPTPAPRARCSVAAILGKLEGQDRDALVVAIGDDRFTGEAIAQALRAEGHQVSGHTVQRHRRGRCSCDAR